MTVYLILFLIAFCLVNLLDLSGFVEDGIKPFLARVFKVSKSSIKDKPWFCSYCLSHHIGLLYLLFSHNATLINYGILLLICFLTPVIRDLLYLIRDILSTIVNIIYRLVEHVNGK